MIAGGLSVAEIAKRLHLAATTIKTHVQSLHKRESIETTWPSCSPPWLSATGSDAKSVGASRIGTHGRPLPHRPNQSRPADPLPDDLAEAIAKITNGHTH